MHLRHRLTGFVAGGLALLAAFAVSPPAVAQGQGGGAPVFQNWYLTQPAKNLPVSGTSANVALPTGGFTARVCNTGSNDAYAVLGTGNTVTATTLTGTLIQVGRCQPLNLMPFSVRYTWIAGITATGTSTLRLEVGLGAPTAYDGNATSNGGAGNPGGSSSQVQFNNAGSFGGITGFTSDGTSGIFASGNLKLSGASSGTALLNAPATGGGTLTLPGGTDAILGAASTNTVTNKSLSGAANTFTAIPLGSAVSGVLPAANGGIGVAAGAAANGAIPIGTGSGFALGTLTAGANITITNALGSITIASTSGGGSPCTTTALSLQYNNGGSLGCVSGVISNGTVMQFNDASLLLENAAGNGGVVFHAPVGAGSSNLTFPLGPDTIAGIAATQTITNKTINGSNNTITNVAISTAVSGLGTGIAAFLSTPSSANLAAAVTDEVGSGSLVFGSLGGSTSKLATISGSLVNGNGVKVNATGDIVDLTYLPAPNGLGSFVTGNTSPTMTDFNFGCRSITVDATGANISAPAISAPAGGGCYVVTTPFNHSVTFTPSGSDLVNGVNAAVTINANTTAFITADATLGWGVPIGATGAGGSGCAPAGTAGNVLTDNGSGACNSNVAFTYSSGIASLGTAGSTLGAVAFHNLTSGTLTLQPQTGALGTVTLTLPAATDQLIARATTDTLTNKSISGSSNTITNISLATGVTGNLPVANLNSGTNADATHYWRGDNTWAPIPGGGTGTVTAVYTGAGLTGGPITVSGEIDTTVTPNIQTGTTYATQASDGGKVVTFSNASAVAVTLSQAINAGFGSGFGVDYYDIGLGTVTVTPTNSTINGAATLIIPPNEDCSVFSDGTNYQATCGFPAGGGKPTPTGTGTPTITASSTDYSGEVTSGTAATSVIITFAAAKTNAPVCTVTPQTQLAAFAYTVSASAITITETATTGEKIDYVCVPR